MMMKYTYVVIKDVRATCGEHVDRCKSKRKKNPESFHRRLQWVNRDTLLRLPHWAGVSMVTEKQASPQQPGRSVSNSVRQHWQGGEKHAQKLTDFKWFWAHRFISLFLKPAPTVPLFGLHCVRMLRRKTEVKAQGFTLKAAMRNSVVSHSIRARDGLDCMDFVSDLICSVRFGGGLEASCVAKKMHSRSVGSTSTWLGLNQTTMWTTEVYVMPICMFIQRECQTFNISISPSSRQVYLCGSIRTPDASKCSWGMETLIQWH